MQPIDQCVKWNSEKVINGDPPNDSDIMQEDLCN